jgi:hypothetical protein
MATNPMSEVLRHLRGAAPLWRDLAPLLDEELSRLPDRYRAVLLLCDLEGKTRKEAARRLGVPEGTVAGRLARARALLARRLARRDLALAVGTLAALLSEKAAPAGVPAALGSATVEVATLVARGPAAAGALPPGVAALTEGVLKAMLLTKLKFATAVLLLVGVLGAGLGAAGLVRRTQAAEQAPAAAEALPPAKGGDKKPAPRRGDAAEDLLRDARARAAIAEQRLAFDVEQALGKARDRYAGHPAAALRVIRAALARVLDDPDVGERARNDLLAKLVAGRRELTEAES